MSIVANRKAYHDYFVEEKFEAGLALEGWEVKAIRAGRAQLKEAYVIVKNGGDRPDRRAHHAVADGVDAHPPDPTRTRKLLMHRAEINRSSARSSAPATRSRRSICISVKVASRSRSVSPRARSSTTSARPKSCATGTAKSSGSCARAGDERIAAGPTLRSARDADGPAITAIYAHHVRAGSASFELEAPDGTRCARRFRRSGTPAACPTSSRRAATTSSVTHTPRHIGRGPRTASRWRTRSTCAPTAQARASAGHCFMSC